MATGKLIRFIHIKKNGGTSVYKFLRKNKVNFLCGDGNDINRIFNQHLPAKKYTKEDSWKFCVARNPYSRVVSFYNWTMRLPHYRHVKFENFVKDKFEKGRAKGVWDLQLDYILDENGKCLVDKIFYFENMAEEIKEHFSIDAKFPFLNQSTEGNYRDLYDDESKEIVYDRLRKDFEYFGYEK